MIPLVAHLVTRLVASTHPSHVQPLVAHLVTRLVASS